MTHIARWRARRRAAGRGGEAAAQWRDLLAALACGEVGPGGQAHQRYALVNLLGELHALRQPTPPQVVVVIDEIDALAEEACGPLGADLARRLEKGRSAGVALAVVGSRPAATWIPDGPEGTRALPLSVCPTGQSGPRKGDPRCTE